MHECVVQCDIICILIGMGIAWLIQKRKCCKKEEKK